MSGSVRGASAAPVMDLVDLKPDEPAEGAAPWRDEMWLGEALAWIDAQLAGAGLRRSGVPALRGRMWSVVARVPVGRDGAVWFKASPPGSAFEPGLVAAIERWEPRMVPRVLAIDAARAWALSMDAGSRLGELLERDPDPGHLVALLRRYAGLQRALAAHEVDLLGLGVPDLRPAVLPHRLECLLDDPAVRAALDGEQLRALGAFVPVFAERCRRLESFGVPASLDHGDLHPNNVLGCGEDAVAFDWGDASLTHPFSSLLVLQRASARLFGADALGALRSAYLGPWLEAGYQRVDLQRAADFALLIAPVARAMAWDRVFPCFAGAQEPKVYQARWIARLLSSDPLGDLPAGA